MKDFFNSIYQSFIDFFPKILQAIFVFLIGWFLAKWIGKLVNKFLNKVRLNEILKQMGWREPLAKVDLQLNAPQFFGELFRWFFVILFLAVSAEILNLSKFSQFLEKIILYFPNILVASLIFIIAIFLSNFSKKVMVGTLEKEKIVYSGFLGRFLNWIIWTLAILAILYQLKIVPALILIIFAGVVGIVTLALGLAFGLGGKEIVAKILKDFEKKFK
jgi:small-conductance mechanosensitive channel